MKRNNSPAPQPKKRLPLILMAAFLVFCIEPAFAVKFYEITSNNSFTGGQIYCQNATASNLSATFNVPSPSCTGPATSTTLTVTWYSSTDNSTNTAGDDVSVSTVGATVPAAVGTVTYTYTPSTAAVGTLYYYVVLSSPERSGACGGFTPTLTTAGTQPVIVKTAVARASAPTNNPIALALVNKTIAGGWRHSLALCASDGTVWSWGYDAQGQLGDDVTLVNQPTPVAVSTLTGIVAISGGYYYSLALKSDGTIWSWGGGR